MRKIKRSEIPAITAAILKSQEYKCALCKQPLRSTSRKRPALDHCHDSGAIRGVLCINCNGMEGKILNRVKRAAGKMSLIDWLANLVRYWHKHRTNQHGLIHPTHLTEDEKRLRRNKLARERRKKKA
jgi:hypothetical protein